MREPQSGYLARVRGEIYRPADWGDDRAKRVEILAGAFFFAHLLHSFSALRFLFMADRNSKAGNSLVYIFALTERERDGYRTTFTALAKKYQEYLNFVVINAVEYASMAPALGLEPGVFPALAVQNPMLGQVFPFDQKRTITSDAAETFVLDIVQGKTRPAGSDGGGIVHDDL
jgi:hypothetical protein